MISEKWDGMSDQMPKRELEVKKQFSDLVSKIGFVQDSLSELEKRLFQVMRKEEKIAEKSSEKAVPIHVLAPFADDIRDQMCRVDSIGNRILYILEHLEI